MSILWILAVIILTPVVGCLITGLDRIITARMQGRKGPPLLQPLYDVIKLWQKESIEVNPLHRFYVYISLVFVIFAVSIILLGGDLLLAIFVLTLGSIFFILGGYASNSPYSFVGSERELLQMMAYEPMVLLACVGFYFTNGSFAVADILKNSSSAIILLPGVFLGIIYILTFKLRKSPFDLSMSHHGHQEIVKGITTEYSGKDLAIIEMTHWYETVLALSLVYLFVVNSNPISHLYAVLTCIGAYILEIIIDNGFARFKWQFAFGSTWIVTGVLAAINLVVLSFFR